MKIITTSGHTFFKKDEENKNVIKIDVRKKMYGAYVFSDTRPGKKYFPMKKWDKLLSLGYKEEEIDKYPLFQNTLLDIEQAEEYDRMFQLQEDLFDWTCTHGMGGRVMPKKFDILFENK